MNRGDMKKYQYLILFIHLLYKGHLDWLVGVTMPSAAGGSLHSLIHQ